MKQKSYGSLLVVFIVCIVAFGFGAVFGSAHIGEDFSKSILPTSLTRSSDIVQVIDEKSFEPENITVKFQTQTKVKQVTRNYTNASNYTNSSSKKSSDNDDHLGAEITNNNTNSKKKIT